MPSKLEEKFQQSIRDRFGISELQTEPLTRENMIHQETPEQREFKHYQRHMEEIRQKFDLPADFSALVCEGQLGARLAQNEKLLSEAMIEDARAKRGSMKLCTATVKPSGGKVHKFWYEISI